MITPVILCGGSGRRLWPVSRRDLPKQFLPLLGERSLFQQTLLRVSDPDRFDRPIVVAAEPLRFIAADQARRVGASVDLLLEPEPRGTAMAVAVAAERLCRDRPDALMLAMPADHAVDHPDLFAADCDAARPVAEERTLVLFGVAPTEPEIDYGYVSPGPEPVSGAERLRPVAVFTEKPAQTEAERAIAAGALWNSGMLLARADAVRATLRQDAPEIAAAAAEAVAEAEPDLDFLRLAAKAYARAPGGSIDRAVLERSDQLAVIETRCGWRDIASWDSVWRASAENPAVADQDGNVGLGRAQFEDSRRALAHADPRMSVAVLGLDDAMVVATRDAVLVADRRRAKEVRALVDRLDREGVPEVRANPQVFRPWGSFESIGAGERYQVKKIVVEPGQKLSLQKHYHRSEHWIVVKGTAEVTRDEETLVVRENESIYLPQGCVHRLANPGKIALELIEVQVGSYLGEDDIVRLEDVYNRNR